MADTIRINGIAFQVGGLRRSTTQPPAGPPLEEISFVVFTRGNSATNDLAKLLRKGPLRLGLPNGDLLEVAVTQAHRATSEAGEASVARFDLTVQETPASAERRAAAAVAAAAVAAAEAAATPPDQTATTTATAPTVADAALPEGDIDSVTLSAPATTWAAAIRQLSTPLNATADPAAPIELPLATAQLAGAEAVLVGLRLEALIDALDQRGVLRRSQIDDAFLRLIETRFAVEATPVIGEAAAGRIAKELSS